MFYIFKREYTYENKHACILYKDMIESIRCETCNLGFMDIAYYRKHLRTSRHLLRSSNDSDIVPSIGCTCGKLYSFPQSLRVHQKKCAQHLSSKTVPTVQASDKKSVVQRLRDEKKELREKLISYEKKQEEYEKQQEEMKAQIAMLLDKHSSTTNSHNNTNSHNTHQNITININAFGNENTDYLDDKAYLSCIDRVYKSIPSLLEKLHFDPKHPENHNIKITNKKLPYASVMGDNQKWKTVDRKGAIESMVQKGYNLLDDKYTENKDKFSTIKRQNFEEFQSKFEADDKDLVRELKSDVDMMVINGSTTEK